MLPAQPNQSLLDGLTCLQALAGLSQPVGVRELARRLGLEPTRVQRLLATLAHLGLAERTAEGRYGVGPAMHVLAAQSLYASGLLRCALGPLAGLQRHGLAVALGVLWRDQVSYLYHAEPQMAAAEAVGRVAWYPAERSSIGQVLLAQQAEPRTAELERIRQAGHACIWSAPGEVIETVAVPLGEPAYAAMALAGTIPADRLPELLDALREAAAAITAAARS